MENIIGKNIYLRPLTLEDTDLLVDWRNKERVLSNFFRQVKITKEGHENWFHKMVDSGEVIEFVIYQKEKDCPIGCVYLQNIEWENNKAEEGVFIGEESALGKGYAKEAIQLILDYGFKEKGLHKIVARVLPENNASRYVHEAAGYKEEAYLKDEVIINGKYSDLVVYAIFNPY